MLNFESTLVFLYITGIIIYNAFWNSVLSSVLRMKSNEKLIEDRGRANPNQNYLNLGVIGLDVS